ncbi:MAG: transcription factor [Candidatus Syntrophoarchaeum sp.]|nr:transcription factor [Candidatus Syntrophoarchaeum sp.]
MDREVLENPVVYKYFKSLIGDDGLKVLEVIPDSEITDERITELVGLDLNTVRRTLYILYESRLMKYRREKSENSGWLTYYWQIKVDELDRVINDEIEKLKKILEQKLEFEDSNVFYSCKYHSVRFVFDDAAQFGFKCPYCEESLDYEDNSLVIDAIKRKLSELGSF